ncbi:MAG TPA: flavodoxin domain-containing protein [Nocardioides sp.]|jgi:hypothetical protein|nr:flavodoxin domain-containing protein [Nocardioides sp.]
MADEQNVKAVVIYESFFGNTESIARAIAGGLRLEGVGAAAVDVVDAQGLDLDRFDLVVVGGPTHAFALSRPSTRDDAAARGGDDRYATRGLREWLSGLPRCEGTHLAAAFDTRVSKVRHLPMSAARSAARLLNERRFTLVDRPTGFVVQDVEGPLEQREMERAIAWARSLARKVQVRIEVATDRRTQPGY